jgi:hypothetical protein
MSPAIESVSSVDVPLHSRTLNEVRLQIGEVRHDWPALLPRSLQGQLPCENGERLCVLVGRATSRRCVGGEPELA